jgi:hypothetical protein
MQYVRNFRSNPRIDVVARRPVPDSATEQQGSGIPFPTGTDAAELPEFPATPLAADWYSFLGLPADSTLGEIQARISSLGSEVSPHGGTEFGEQTAGRLSAELMDAVSVFSDERRRLLHDELLARNPGHRIGASELRGRELQLSIARANAVEARHRMEEGDAEEAKRLLRRAVDLDPDSTSYRRALDACEHPDTAKKVLRTWLSGPAR